MYARSILQGPITSSACVQAFSVPQVTAEVSSRTLSAAVSIVLYTPRTLRHSSVWVHVLICLFWEVANAPPSHTYAHLLL